ncbi:hypothetical protein [Sphingomonas sp. STIS6.2]|uniref:hypothetical protein n=1 Tax=Sphingomonas sp. STIS6.2 TaxID=1379700 RepID=UPI001F37BA73|nr:hypothetical protein [Sphingomonas sp. STIS6.2]
MLTKSTTASRKLAWPAGALALAMGLAGCMHPSDKIATGLVRYGLDERQARCMGDRLEANLSIGQLQQLGRAARAVNKGDVTPSRLTVSDLVRVSSQFNDAKVPIEVTKAAAGCGVLAGPGAAL